MKAPVITQVGEKTNNINMRDTFALDVLEGLSKDQKELSARYFYDSEGSEIFKKITELPDYYLTNCELEILMGYGDELARASPVSNLIELGAGSGKKTEIIIDAFRRCGSEISYYPIDISEDSVEELCQNLQSQYPDVNVHGVCGDYLSGLKFLHGRLGPKMVIFLGSNIGNFSPQERGVFFRSLWQFLDSGDRLLLGVDLLKDPRTMLDAYNDPVTAGFNFNLLRRINRELDADFDVDAFQHFAAYNPVLGAMESFLISNREQVVNIKKLHRNFAFKQFEAIHCEYSCKFFRADLAEIPGDAGFSLQSIYYDERRYFADLVFAVEK